MGLFSFLGGSTPTVPQFTPKGVDPQTLKDIQRTSGRIEDLSQKEITDPRMSYDLTATELGRQRDVMGDTADRDIASAMKSAQQQTAIAGGLGTGASSRIAQKGLVEGLRGKQQLSSKYQDIAGQAMIGDIASQEAEKSQALFAAPSAFGIGGSIEANAADTYNRAMGGQIQAQALANQAGQSKWGQIGSIAGMAMGAGGGPAGMMMGGAAGRIAGQALA